MLVVKGKYSGFCFGVKRAVDEAEKLSGKNNYILGEIIHNERVIESLKKKGIKTINSLDEVKFDVKDKLLIRTHGEPKETFEKAKNLGVEVVDCTCPFVKEIHKIVQTHFAKGYQIVIIGNAEHPEVKGIDGWCDNTAIITEDPDVVSKISSNSMWGIISLICSVYHSSISLILLISRFTYMYNVRFSPIFKLVFPVSMPIFLLELLLGSFTHR